MWSSGGPETGMFGGGYGAGAGFKWGALSVDAFYEHENGAVNLPGPNATLGSQYLSAFVSDNTAWGTMAKYTFDLGGGFKDGGYKDGYVPGGKVTLYAGYMNIDFSNPTDPVSNFSNTIGGYALNPVTNNRFATDLTRQLAWTGATYEVDKWRFTGAYYWYGTGDYLKTTSGVVNNCAQETQVNRIAKAAGSGIGNPVGANCHGDFNQVSFVADYEFTKHFDVYTGVSWTETNGGLNSTALQTEQLSVMSGVRPRF
jgi:predicted porin